MYKKNICQINFNFGSFKKGLLNMKKEQLILAIDKNNFNEALSLCQEVKDDVGMFKLGLEFFLSFGTEGVNKIAELGVPIFLDLKLHDIPNTVSKSAVAMLKKVKGVSFLTLHASGGRKMLEETRNALETANLNKTKLFGVTVLTSTEDELDSWESYRVLFPFAMVSTRAINIIKKLKKSDQETSIAIAKLCVMIENANNSLIYWTRLYEAEKLRIEIVNQAFKKDENIKHLGLQLKPNIGTKEFYKKNFSSGVLNDVIHFSNNAYNAGIEGIVCSALEVKFVKNIFPSLKVITPGIRPLWYKKNDDQSRTMTPQKAILQGADFLVIGRPITEDVNPKQAIFKTLTENEATEED